MQQPPLLCPLAPALSFPRAVSHTLFTAKPHHLQFCNFQTELILSLSRKLHRQQPGQPQPPSLPGSPWPSYMGAGHGLLSDLHAFPKGRMGGRRTGGLRLPWVHADIVLHLGFWCGLWLLPGLPGG